MEKIISNIKKNKKIKKNINDGLMTTFELELNYKIECEKTKQLQLIKDIRKIEKNIKEKELYNKRKNNINFDKKMSSDYTDSCESDLSDSDNSDNSDNSDKSDNSDNSDNSDKFSEYKNNKDDDSISLCSYNSSYSYNEIEIMK
jgi:hypothetical protein